MNAVLNRHYHRASEYIIAQMIATGKWESDNITEEDILIFFNELLEYISVSREKI